MGCRKHQAGGLVGDGAEAVAGRKGGTAACRWTNDRAFQIGLNVGEGDGGTRRFKVLQGPLLGGVINLPQVIDTGLGLGLGARAHDVGHGDHSEEADEGHHEHDFDQRESRSV